ncbi:MAG: hypothetical protein WC519_00155 [Parcubacteria group bacterium]
MSQKKDEQSDKRPKTNYKGTVRTVAGISLLAIAVAAYFFFGRNAGGAALTVETEGPVRIGEPFDISVTLENKSDGEISEASISLALPSGTSFADEQGDLRRTGKIKSIPAGSFERETFRVVITEFSEDKVFKAEAEYLPLSLGRTIKTSKDLSIKVEKWLSLELRAPDKVVSGEEFEWVLSYANDTDKDWNVDLAVETPDALKTELPEKRIKVAAGERKSEAFTASIIMEENKNFEIKATAKGNVEGKEYVLADAMADVMIATSPLSLNISGTKRITEALSPGEQVAYSLSFRNNSDTVMKNISLKATLVGEMFDVSSVESAGSINAGAKTITWDIGSTPGLAELNPSESKSLSFSVKLVDTYPIKRLNDRNFTVGIDARIESPTIPYTLKTVKTVNVVSLTQKVAGKAEAIAKAFYRDAGAGIINEGPFPPVVGTPTEYSIHWGLVNYSTDMSDVSVSAELPPGVEFVKQVKVDAGEFSADPMAKKITWKVPKVLATTGVLSEPISAIFKIKATPNAGQADGYMPILGPTNITAADDFTGFSFSGFQEYLTTELPADSTVKAEEGIVR